MTEASTIRIPTAQEWGDRILGASNTLRMLVNNESHDLARVKTVYPSAYDELRAISVTKVAALVRAELSGRADDMLADLTKEMPELHRPSAQSALAKKLHNCANVTSIAEHIVDSGIQRQSGRTI